MVADKKNLFLLIFTNRDYTDIIGHYVKQFKIEDKVKDIEFKLDKNLDYLLPFEKYDENIEFEYDNKILNMEKFDLFNLIANEFYEKKFKNYHNYVNMCIWNTLSDSHLDFLEAYSKNNKEYMKKIIDDDVEAECGVKKNSIYYYQDTITGRYRKLNNKEITNNICDGLIGETDGFCSDWIKYIRNTQDTRKKKKHIYALLSQKKYFKNN